MKSSIPQRIKSFNNGRVEKFLPLKYAVMAENPFRFFRGTCHLFYEDLAASGHLPAFPQSWICGDMHVENFGSYRGDNRLVYFDINDFDEAILAPVTWELARMVCSIFVALEVAGLTKPAARKLVKKYLDVYSRTLSLGKARYLEPKTATGIVKIFLKKVGSRKQKTLIRERTARIDNRTGLITDNKRLFPVERTDRKALTDCIAVWAASNLEKKYLVPDLGFRIAGTGSIGIERYLFLLRNARNPQKYLLLDMKEARPSSLLPYVAAVQPAWNSEAERITSIQDQMQNICPALLGSVNFNQKSWVVREMQPTADKIDIGTLCKRKDDLDCVITDMALLSASAQLRAAGRRGASLPDELIAFGKELNWQQQILEYGAGYAVQVKKDYASFLRAYKAGFFTPAPPSK